MSYLAELNRIKHELEQPSNPQPHTNLHARFLDWYNSLPEISRCRPFAMLEIEQALNTQGKYISPILLSEGWQRKRKWNSIGQYPRYWLPKCAG